MNQKLFKEFIVFEKENIRRRPSHAQSLLVLFRIKKETNFLHSKSKLKENGEFNNAYITEDLTTLRSKLFNYIKNECDGEFVLVHTYNGSICAKRSALNHGKLNDGKKDEGIGNWLTINSTDDLFKINIDLDFEKLGYKPLMINT